MLRADLLNLAISLRIAVPFPVLIEGVFFQPDPFELDERLPDLRGVTFQDCYFEELHFEAVGTPIPAFRECVVQRLLGRSSYTDLPADRFVNTSVNDFEVAANTNASIRATTNLTTGEKVLLTVLRKLFVQSLGGRSEPALYRGLDTAERQFVDPIVRILAQQQLITLMNRGDGAVWIPVRRKLDYIRKLLANPGSPDDVLMAEARRLSA